MKISIFYLLSIFISISINAQISESSELFKMLQTKDSLMFEAGFNQCQMDVIKNITHDELDFYHDKGGVQNKEQFLKAMKNNICSSPNKKPIRKLVPNSLEVFELKNNGQTYGAIQKGVHEFYIKEPNKDLYITNIAKFTSLFILEDGAYVYKTIFSYDHQDPRGH